MKWLFVAVMMSWMTVVQADSPEAAFSPGGAEALIVRTIESARQEILVAAYTFTDKALARALVDASKRGVSVRVVLDKSQRNGRYSAATFLANAGIRVRIDENHSIMHSKFILVDGSTLQTGSFNYTTAAARQNAENVVVIWNNPDLALLYARDWLEHWGHSMPYAARH